MALADRLRDHIIAHGPMRFDAWMEACLYDLQDGYYMRPGRKTGAGDDADFATSPTLHPFMGTCVANEVAAAADALGVPPDVFEFGGGEGDLARAAGQDLPGLRWHHIERSPTHRAAQAGSGRTETDLPEGARGVVVAHEFLDALPFRWMERTPGGWADVTVAWQDGFVERLDDADDGPEVDVPPGQRVAWMPGAEAWLRLVAHRLTGRVVIIDYGGDAVWRRDPAGTVRTFRRHRDAGSPLEAPGDKDITASVDFAWLRQAATRSGFQVVSEESQEAFLLRHGVLDALNAIDRNSPEGASAYLRLRQMLIPHAGGMGHAFRVLILERRS